MRAALDSLTSDSRHGPLPLLLVLLTILALVLALLLIMLATAASYWRTTDAWTAP